jgi:UDP-glucose 4-epimerase
MDNVPRQAIFYQMDIASPAVGEMIEGEQFDVIFHQAAQVDVRTSVKDPVEDAQVNILGTVNLLEAARKAGTQKFIFASSGGTCYGEQQQFPAPEDHPLHPIAPYGISKVAAEHYLYFYYYNYGIEYVALRYGNVYGPRQNPHGEAGVVAIFANKILNGKQPVINGDGEQTRDYVHVFDVARANICALDYEGVGAFNVGTGVETNVQQVFRAVNQHLGNLAAEQYGEAKPGEQRRSVLAITKIYREMGWTPHFDFDHGIQQTMQWFRQAHQQNQAQQEGS